MHFSMTPLFDTCERLLWRLLLPTHYSELTRAALSELKHECRRAEEFNKIKEDVREKLLEKGRRGLAYIPKPHCLAIARDWFSTDPHLFNAHPIELPLRPQYFVDACVETVYRGGHMQIKNPRADLIKVLIARFSGLSIEEHVRSYFRQWPDQFKEADNFGKYDQWCDHDFKLRIGGRWYKFDVAGPRYDGLHGDCIGGKKATDYHILASFVNSAVEMRGWITGDAFHEARHGEQSEPMYRLVVRLNCDRDGMNYNSIRQTIK